MTHSKIERSFGRRTRQRELTPEEKYFWMYLQTNANVNTLVLCPGCERLWTRQATTRTRLKSFWTAWYSAA